MDKKKLEEYRQRKLSSVNAYDLSSSVYTNITIKAIDMVNGKIEELKRTNFNSNIEYAVYLDCLTCYATDKLARLPLYPDYLDE